MSEKYLVLMILIALVFTAGVSAYCFVHDSPVLGAINAVFVVVNLISFIKAIS